MRLSRVGLPSVSRFAHRHPWLAVTAALVTGIEIGGRYSPLPRQDLSKYMTDDEIKKYLARRRAARFGQETEPTS